MTVDRRPGTIELDPRPDGQIVIGRADQSLDISMLLLQQLLESCASNQDGLVAFRGVDAGGSPREVTYLQVGFNRTSNPEANEGGFVLLERLS